MFEVRPVNSDGRGITGELYEVHQALAGNRPCRSSPLLSRLCVCVCVVLSL